LFPSRCQEYRLQSESGKKKIPPEGGTPNEQIKGIADPQPPSGNESFGVVEEEKK
jgi:hypothetical protein